MPQLPRCVLGAHVRRHTHAHCMRTLLQARHFFVRYSARQGGREHLDTEAPQSMSHSCSFLSRPTAVYSRGHEPCSVEAMSHPTGEAQGHAFAC